MNKEIWKDISGYEGIYQVSNFGRIKSLERTTVIHNAKRKEKEKILTLTDNGNGYLLIKLSNKNKRKNFYIHRLVAEAFIPNPDNKMIINHLDYNTKNNRVDNLEWCTQKENMIYSKEHLKCRKNITHSNTGEKYISYRKKTKRYRITIDRKEYCSCKTLEYAIKKRDEILNE